MSEKRKNLGERSADFLKSIKLFSVIYSVIKNICAPFFHP